MKKCFVVIVFVLLIFFFALPCIAQEGCGRWVEVSWMGWSEVASLCTFGTSLTEGDVKCPDSVWVPEECPPEDSSKRYWNFILADLLIVAFDSLARFALPDTYYQESQQTWRWVGEEKERRCQESWECVREKLIEFLEERDR